MRRFVHPFGLFCVLTAVAACGGPLPASDAQLEAHMTPSQQIERTTRRAQYDARHTNPKSACFQGLVQTPGPLGGPLERVHVQVRHEQIEMTEATTDFAGRFHVCVAREKTSVGERLLIASRPYRDKTVDVTLTLTREGFAPKTMTFVWDTENPPKDLEISLEKQ
jgi:hypothetical protein